MTVLTTGIYPKSKMMLNICLVKQVAEICGELN